MQDAFMRRIHFNAVRPHSSLNYRPPALEATLPAWPAAQPRPASPATLPLEARPAMN